MKRLIIIMIALILCVAPLSVAQASNHNYIGLKDCYIQRRGDHGSEVRRVQQRLSDLGYLTDKVDGSFGPNTESAVWEFQRKNGITPSGVATMFTQAVLYGSDALYAWNNNRRSNTGTGEYGVRNSSAYYIGNDMEASFEFVNYDTKNVEAICIYYWLDDGNRHLVEMNKSDYYQQWYYNMKVPYNGTSKVSGTFYVRSSELKKAHQLRCVVGEIAYEDGSVVVTMNAVREPYQNGCYVLGSW